MNIVLLNPHLRKAEKRYTPFDQNLNEGIYKEKIILKQIKKSDFKL
jgi:hypothetical protein